MSILKFNYNTASHISRSGLKRDKKKRNEMKRKGKKEKKQQTGLAYLLVGPGRNICAEGPA